MEKMRLEKHKNILFFSYSGELTLEVCNDLKQQLEPLFNEDDFSIFAADLAETTFLDSSGIGFLVALNNRMKQSGKSMALVSPSQPVVKTLKLVQLLSYFKVLNDRAALEPLSS